MVAGALKKVGVEAVVEGLGKFIADVGKMNSSMSDIGGQGNILTRALGGVTSAFGYLANKIVDVATYALGQLLARAVEFVITQMAELVKSTIEAGAEFQTMELRLKRLNFNTLIESGQDYNTAMAEAVELTKEQLSWIQKLAVQTPYDATDIANVFTLARSYGFAAAQAQGLTQDISNFAAGMGLGNTEIERIIVNFGQMVQQGKVTQRELNDLARGAFVPVNDILKRMQENVGKTGKEFDKFKTSGEGVNAFMTAFSQIVQERFQGAASDMARTFEGATNNAKDFVKSLVGFGIVKPVLAAVGGAIADLVNSLTTPERWDALTAAAARVGDELSGLVSDILGLLPSTDNLADGIVKGLDNIASWIGSHRSDIVGFFENTRAKILEIWDALKNRNFEGFLKAIGLDDQTIGKITGFTDKIVKTFDTIKGWVDKNGETIKTFFETLGEIAGGVFENLTGIKIGKEGGLDGFLQGVKKFMDFVIANKDEITTWTTRLIELWGILQIIGFVVGTVIVPILTTLVGIVAFVASVIAVLTVVIGLLTSPIFIVAIAIGLLVEMFIEAAKFGRMLGDGLAKITIELVPIVSSKFGELKENVIGHFTEMRDNVFAKFTELTDGATVKSTELRDSVSARFIELRDSAIARVAELRDSVSARFIELRDSVIARVAELRDSVSAKFNELKNNVVTRIADLRDSASAKFNELKNTLIQIANGINSSISASFNELKNVIIQKMTEAKNTLVATVESWTQLGADVIKGVVDGVLSMESLLIETMKNIALTALNAAMNILGIHSPSLEGEYIGEMTVQGIINGIYKKTGLLQDAMANAVQGMMTPAFSLPAMTQQLSVAAPPTVNHTNNYTSNYNLAISSNAAVEPIIQDYNMLKSLAGA